MATFKHSGDLEEILFSLPAIKALGGGVLFLDVAGGASEPLVQKHCLGGRTRFDLGQFELIRSLLLEQLYLSDVRIWRGEVIERNLDSFRPLVADGAANPAVLHVRAFGLNESLAVAPWLTISSAPIRLARSHLVHRSARNQASSLQWSVAADQLARDAIFVGAAMDHEIFQYTFGSTIDLHVPCDALEVARMLRGSDCLSGNQSWIMALAISLGTRFYLEPLGYGPVWDFQRPNCGFFSSKRIASTRVSAPRRADVLLQDPQNSRKTLTFKHSGNLGDIIYSLAAIKAMGGGALYLDISGGESDAHILADNLGKPNKFDLAAFEFIRPLLVEQPYIHGVHVWRGEEVDHNLDDVRQYTDPNLNLVLQYFRLFGIDSARLAEPWLTMASPPIKLHKAVIINRTPRYHSKDRIWERDLPSFISDAIFIGFPKEHEFFQYTFGCRVDLHTPRDALEIARILAGSRALVGNQSFVMSLAIGLGTRFSQEVCNECPNCLFPRANGEYF